MSRILKVSQSDYRLQVQSGGNIVLDVGNANAGGLVTITGNLDVKGITTTVESINTSIKDNILLLNAGETSAGISSALGYKAGIEIDRGQNDNAQILFSEQYNAYNGTSDSNTVGAFVLQTANKAGTGFALSSLRLRGITTDGTADLTFDVQQGLSILRVANTPANPQQGDTYGAQGYADRVSSDPTGNAIPNKQYVIQSITNVADVTQIHYPISVAQGAPYNSQVITTANTINFNIGGNNKTTISNGGLTVNNINLLGDTINNTGQGNLTFTATNNTIELNGVLQLDNQITDPLYAGSTNRIYSKGQEGPGRTGLFFINTSPYGGNIYNNDELVSKNRAVLLSILL
jgi:hypothetical protein